MRLPKDSALAITLAQLMIAVAGQQLDGYIFPFDNLGLSSSCFAAINTTVSSCPAWLARLVDIDRASFDLLDSSQLKSLCEASCQSDLSNLRNTVVTSCNSPTDVMVPGSIAYPATFLIDRYLYAIDVSCLKDPTTGQYCDVLIAGWSNQSEYTREQNCSACELEIQRRQNQSPFGYNKAADEDFSSLTSSCSATGYTYTTPTGYALNSTTALPVPTCAVASYNIQPNDTCVSISGANNVSTYGLITENKFDLQCAGLPAVGQKICLSRPCKAYQLEMNDTCDFLATNLGISMAQLLAWNPMIKSDCSDLAPWRGWYLCASSPDGVINVPVGSGVTTAAPVPTNAQEQSNKYCGQWYLVKEGDYCSLLTLKYGISLSDFYWLNPQVDNKTCSNLWRDTSYCVEPVGDISTYPNYPITTAKTSFTRPPTSPPFTPTPVSTPALEPTASGTICNCYLYENAFNATVGDFNSLNACKNWATYASVTVDDLITWNPSLSAASCVLQPGYSYCIRLWERSPNVTLPHEYCFAPNTTLIPTTSVQPSDCDCYIQLRSSDKGVFNCSMFPSNFNISLADVTALNPWIGLDCDAGVWSKLSSDGYEQICVHKGNSTIPTPTTGCPNVPPAPTQPGTIATCNKWHVVKSGDGCWAIANQYSITLDNFYSWNPGVGSDCSKLWLGYAVCVGA